MTKCKKVQFAAPIYPSLQLCAGGMSGKDSCQGDSGSGLFDATRGKKIKVKLVGVVSWGTSKCGISKPGVYVKVVTYLDWILNSLGKWKIHLALHLLY